MFGLFNARQFLLKIVNLKVETYMFGQNILWWASASVFLVAAWPPTSVIRVPKSSSMPVTKNYFHIYITSTLQFSYTVSRYSRKTYMIPGPEVCLNRPQPEERQLFRRWPWQCFLPFSDITVKFFDKQRDRMLSERIWYTEKYGTELELLYSIFFTDLRKW